MTNKIPQTFIDQLLSRIDIVDVIDNLVALKKTGSNYMACCPFHQEKNASFSVSPGKQFYHCFGCGASGNAITFLMNYEGLSFPESIKQLAHIAGLEIPVEQSHSSDHSDSLNALYDTTHQVAQFYQQELKKSPIAVEYLKNRGLSGDTAKRYGLGYAPPGWDNVINACKDTSKQQLLQTGLVIKKENEEHYYDRFRHRIMYPIRDRRGRVIGFGGRVLDDSTPKYLNSPETPIFHKGNELYGLYEARQAQRNLDQILIVEGYMDVLMLAEKGIHYAVATLGTATTSTHLKLLLKQCPKIIFCFDGDDAGRTAAWRALEITLPTLSDTSQISFMFLDQDEDPDSWIQKHGKIAFEKYLEQAKPLSTFLFEHLLKDINLSTVDGRSRLNQLAMSYIEQIPNNYLKQGMIDELGKMTRIENTVVPVKKSQAHSTSRSIILPSTIRSTISLILQTPSLATLCPDDLATLNLPGSQVLAELIVIFKENPEQPVGVVLERWRDTTIGQELNRLLTAPLLIPENGLEAEMKDALISLKTLAHEQEIEGLMAKAATPQGLALHERQNLQRLLKEKNA